MSNPEDSYISDPEESTLTFDQACFLAEFTEIKNEIEVEIALRKAFIDDVRELTHELPPLGLEHNMMLIYVLIDRTSLNISSDERQIIHELCDQLVVLTKRQSMLVGCERRIRLLRNEAMKLQALYMLKLVRDKKMAKAEREGRPWKTNPTWEEGSSWFH